MALKPTRRDVLRFGSLGSLAVATGCGDDAGGLGDPDAAAQSDAAAVDAGFDCLLTPQQTAGPFYFDPAMVRSYIVEDRDGRPLSLALDVASATDCSAVAGSRVDVWHCDALGLYSGYPNQGDNGDIDTSGMTFLRGTQTTDDMGRVVFDTIYPGWYPGRTLHIHFTVFLPGNTEVTGQLYFPDNITDQVLTTQPYASRGPRDTTNNTDGGATNAADRGILLAVESDAAGYAATLRIGVL